MVKITIMLLIFCFIAFPVQAIGGYLSLDYNTMKENAVGQIKIYEDFFNNKLRIGGQFTTDLFGFNLKDGYFPAGIPKAQYYGLFAEYEIKKGIKLTLNEWCNHWFAQSGKSWQKDTQDITIGFKIDFDNYFSD
jgi:hypothetical protein